MKSAPPVCDEVTSFPSTFTLAESIPGDFNDSLAVDTADYATWRNGSGPLSPFLSSYNVWRENYGRTAGSSSAANVIAGVPEPKR
jgi:hypothetical protein